MDRFTKRSQLILSLAKEEALRLKQNDVGTEHLLLSLLRDEGSVASHTLRALGAEMPKVEVLVTRFVPASTHTIVTEPPLTFEAKRVLEYAVDEARRMGNHFVGTEHLLLGIIRLKQGVAIEVLSELKITPDAIRKQVRVVLSEPPQQNSQQG